MDWFLQTILLIVIYLLLKIIDTINYYCKKPLLKSQEHRAILIFAVKIGDAELKEICVKNT